MDWGATIVFVLSIIGAVMLSDGDLVVGIIAFLVIFCILAVIKSVVGFLTSSDTTNSTPKKETPQETGAAHIGFKEDHLEHTLDMIIRFLNAYSTVMPEEWYHLYISQDFEDIYDETTGYLKFEILLGTWWDGLLRGYPDIDDYMKTIFVFDSHDTKFTCTDIITGRSIKGRFPRDRVNALLQKYLDNYEAKHPKVKFKRESWGAKISNI